MRKAIVAALLLLPAAVLAQEPGVYLGSSTEPQSGAPWEAVAALLVPVICSIITALVSSNPKARWARIAMQVIDTLALARGKAKPDPAKQK